MQLPAKVTLDCPPFGMLNVDFGSQEADPEYNLPGVPEEDADRYSDEVVENWPGVWNSASAMIDELLKEYEYGADLQELIQVPTNTINVYIMTPEEEERYRLNVYLDVGFENGSHVFGVEFEELEAREASATF